MHLEDQIAVITNPQDFTQLCNSIFTSIYKGDFQVIDGTRSDEGNDGYVYSEKLILAIYCPIKPERKIDSDYFKKISSDMQKAAKLRDSGKYDIKRWTFVTPRKLSADIIAKMQKLTTDLSLSANHLESTFLANELYKNPHLLQAFPHLYMPKIDQKLDEILSYLKTSPRQEVPLSEGQQFSCVPGTDTQEDEGKDNNLVKELRKSTSTDKTKTKLKTIYYSTTDTVAKINALMGLLDLYDPAEDSSEDMIGFCEDGIRLTESINDQSSKAYFLAWKGYLLSFIYIMEDITMSFNIMSSNLIGLPLVTEEQRQNTLSRLRNLYEEYGSAFDAALELAKTNNDLQMMAGIILLIGNAAGQRGIFYRKIGISDREKSEEQICKRSLLMAKDIYSYIGDELGVANAIYNLANQLRFFDEKEEALELAKQSIESFNKFDNKMLLQKAILLEESIRTGEIPDYIHGERRNPSS